MDFTQKEIVLMIAFGGMLFLFLVSVIVISLFRYREKQNQFVAEKQRLKEQFEHETLRVKLEIQEETMKNISQEIHDNIGQMISLAKLNLNALPEFENEKISERVSTAENTLDKALNDLRQLARSLFGKKINEDGLEESVKNLLHNIETTGQYTVSFSTGGETVKLNPERELMLFRLVQEAISNTLKHAEAKAIAITVKYQPEKISIVISDDGKGFTPNTVKKGMGLSSMKNRVQLLNGTFDVQSNRNGTKLTITIPPV